MPLEGVKRFLLDFASTNTLPSTVTAQSIESENVVPKEQRHTSKVVEGIAEKLLQSSWAQADLAHEDGVCDFLADRLCSDSGFVSELEVLSQWLKGTTEEAQRETRSLLQKINEIGSASKSGNVAAVKHSTTSRGEEVFNLSPQECKGRLEQLRLNLRAALTIKLPKRSGGSMIHVAAADGGYVVLSGVIRILKLILPCDEWEKILDSRWRSPPLSSRPSPHASTRLPLLAPLIYPRTITHGRSSNGIVAEFDLVREGQVNL